MKGALCVQRPARAQDSRRRGERGLLLVARAVMSSDVIMADRTLFLVRRVQSTRHLLALAHDADDLQQLEYGLAL
jgi:hypothetical protein